eukprot:420808-Prymnesium_polylepis.2
MALALTPPACTHLMTNAALRRLQEVVGEQVLPATDVELSSLGQMLTLASMAGPLLDHGATLQEDKWAATMSTLLHRAMPPLAEMLAADRIRTLQRTAGQPAPPPPPPPESMAKMLGKANLSACHRLFLLYTARALEAADGARLGQLTPLARGLLRAPGAEPDVHLDFVNALVDHAVDHVVRARTAAPPHRRTSAPPHRRTTAPPHRRTTAAGTPHMSRAPPARHHSPSRAAAVPCGPRAQAQLTDEVIESVIAQLLLPVAEASTAAHSELLRLLEAACQPQVRGQLPGGVKTLRLLAALAGEGRHRGMLGEKEVVFDEAYERLNGLIQRK